MHYSKIIKLASYFKEKNIDIYFNLLKLAYSDKLLALVIGSYPSPHEESFSENEMKIRKRLVAKLINDPREVDSTISELAKIIKENNEIKGENHGEIWSSFLSDSQIAELIKLTSEVPSASSGVRQDPERSDEQGAGSVLNYIFEKLKNIKSYHDSIELAKKEVLASEWYIERSDGSRSVGKVEAIDPVQKLAKVWVGRAPDGSSMIKVISFDDILRSNGHSSGTKKLEPLEWLNRSYLYPLSIEKSSGGSYNNCIISNILTKNDSIICNFSFTVGNIEGSDFRYASKEVVIDMSNVASFYAANKDIISSF